MARRRTPRTHAATDPNGGPFNALTIVGPPFNAVITDKGAKVVVPPTAEGVRGLITCLPKDEYERFWSEIDPGDRLKALRAELDAVRRKLARRKHAKRDA